MLQINKGWKSKCCRNVNKIGFILNIVDLKPNIFSVDNLLRSEKQNLSYVFNDLEAKNSTFHVDVLEVLSGGQS